MSVGAPHISLIWAMAENRVIGMENRLPWRMPADLKRFRELTTGHTIVMGRKTFESFPKPLPNRTHVIVTRDRSYAAPAGCIVVDSVDAALSYSQNGSEIFVIGGASLYAQTLSRAQRLYMTLIHAHVVGDALFPQFDTGQWRESERTWHPADATNPFAYSFVMMERRV